MKKDEKSAKSSNYDDADAVVVLTIYCQIKNISILTSKNFYFGHFETKKQRMASKMKLA